MGGASDVGIGTRSGRDALRLKRDERRGHDESNLRRDPSSKRTKPLKFTSEAILLAAIAAICSCVRPAATRDSSKNKSDGEFSSIGRVDAAPWRDGPYDSVHGTTDLERLAQGTLDLPQLDAYYHAHETPGRVPLVAVFEDDVTEIPRLMKFGRAVVVKRGSELSNEKVAFRFTRITVNGDSATVECSYPIEGIHGVAQFIRRGDQWSPTNVQLVER